MKSALRAFSGLRRKRGSRAGCLHAGSDGRLHSIHIPDRVLDVQTVPPPGAAHRGRERRRTGRDLSRRVYATSLSVLID